MTAVATPDAARLVFAAVAGLILLLILIIKFKVHAMISILIGAVGIGLMAGVAAGAALTVPHPSRCKRTLSRWMRAAAGVLDNLEHAVGW